jgi:hypothetical protein
MLLEKFLIFLKNLTSICIHTCVLFRPHWINLLNDNRDGIYYVRCIRVVLFQVCMIVNHYEFVCDMFYIQPCRDRI